MDEQKEVLSTTELKGQLRMVDRILLLMGGDALAVLNGEKSFDVQCVDERMLGEQIFSELQKTRKSLKSVLDSLEGNE